MTMRTRHWSEPEMLVEETGPISISKAEKTYDRSRNLHVTFSVRVHYWLGQAYEASGWNDKAIQQYEKLLEVWKDADEGLESVEDAKERLAKLKHGS